MKRNNLKSQVTLKRLQAIVDTLAATGHKVTQKAVCEYSGLSIVTIKRYWSSLDGVKTHQK